MRLLLLLHKSLVAEDNKRVRKNPKLAALRQQQLDSFLAAEGLEPSDLKELTQGEIIKANADFGFADEKEARMALDERPNIRTEKEERIKRP